MVCHGELARRRPAPAYLTSFYLMVSVGGAIGGLLIGFAAPYFLNGLYDLPIVVSLTGFMLVYLLWRERGQASSKATGNASFLNEPCDKVVIAVLALALWWLHRRAPCGGEIRLSSVPQGAFPGRALRLSGAARHCRPDRRCMSSGAGAGHWTTNR